MSLSASGLPSGATATFSPATVTSGGSSTLTIATSASTPAGTYPVTVTGTGSSATRTRDLHADGDRHRRRLHGQQRHRRGDPGRRRDRDQHHHHLRLRPQRLRLVQVAVNIVHTYRGDLVIDLVAPDGSAYRLKNSSILDSADNVNTTYTVNLSSEAANGVWRLRVQDVYAGDTGYINSWSLTL